MNYSSELVDRAEKIELLLLDVDGVLTDGTLLYTNADIESKTFHTQDGFGLRLLNDIGVATGVITARKSKVVARRAEELAMTHIYQGVQDKLTAFTEILAQTGLQQQQVAYMGDDWLDLKLLARVGLAVCPDNGVREIKDIVHFITPRRGGAGAVRDLCDLIITAKKLHQLLLQRYSGE